MDPAHRGARRGGRIGPARSGPALAWGIHALTASGVVVGVLGLFNVLEGHPRAALLWLMLALVIDGIDGPMARSCDVKQECPRVDGYVLDLIVDFVTCVIVPVAFVHRFELLPDDLSMVVLAVVLLVSAIWMSRTDQETADDWFNGFPSEWNLVVPSLYLLHTSTWVNTVVILFFCAFTLSSVNFPHPVRVRENRAVTLSVTVVWLAVMTGLTIADPRSSGVARIVLVAAPAYFMWLVVRRAFSPSPLRAETDPSAL